MKKQRLIFAAGCGLACTVLAGCGSGRTLVITNTSDQSFEMRRDGATTATVVDPGGSLTLKVPAGQAVDLNGMTMQIY